MRSCLGFIFGKLQFDKGDVPNWLQGKLFKDKELLGERIQSKELIKSLKVFDK